MGQVRRMKPLLQQDVQFGKSGKLKSEVENATHLINNLRSQFLYKATEGILGRSKNKNNHSCHSKPNGDRYLGQTSVHTAEAALRL